MSDVRSIPLNMIEENEAALRPADRQSEQYQGLVDSIRTNGVLNSITVSPIADSDKFRLIDGLQRFSAAGDAGLKEIPAVVMPMEEGDAFIAQILANVHRIDTKPAQYASHLNRVLAGSPTMTMAELAGQLSKSEQWLSGMLRLNKLNDEVKKLVDDNKISLTNAQALAKLPVAEQMSFLEQAQTESPQEFVPKVTERAKAIRKAAREGKEPGEAKFTAVPHLRKLAELKELRTNPAPLKTAMANAGASDAVAFTLDYILQMDPDSVKVQESKDAERKAKKKADAEARAVEKKAAKAEAAKKEAEEARKAYEKKKADESKG